MFCGVVEEGERKQEGDAIVNDTVEGLPVPQGGPVTPMRLLEIATQQGADIDKLGKLMDLQERWEKNTARKAFDAAVSAAKAEIPVISKNREVDFTSSKGRTNYRYEDFAEVARTLDPILSRHGLSYRFRTSSAANEPVTVTCILAHRDGHSEENSLSAGRDESGNKNSIQAIGSTITYLQRYALKAALGVAASVDDDATKTDGMLETVYLDHEAAIDSAADDAALDVAFKEAAAAAEKAGDVSAFASFQKKALERRKAIKAAKK